MKQTSRIFLYSRLAFCINNAYKRAYEKGIQETSARIRCCLSTFTTLSREIRLSAVHILSASPRIMKKIFSQSIDFSKVDTLIYHLPDGPSLSVNLENLEDLFDLEMEMGEYCDTSEIDGVVHFFPKGNA